MKAHEALAIYRLKPKQTVSLYIHGRVPKKPKQKRRYCLDNFNMSREPRGGGLKKKKKERGGVWVLGVQVIVVYAPPPNPHPTPARPSPYGHRCKLSLKRL